MGKTHSILIIGQGSIGVRHCDVLKDFDCHVRTVSRRAGMGDFASIPDALSSELFDIVTICSETSAHITDLTVVKECGFQGAIVIEKPVCVAAEDIDELDPIVNAFVAYNLRFHPVVQKLRTALDRDVSSLISAHLHVAQAMDTWRPGRVRESSYSAFRERGGGVLRDLSHELDLAIWLFGSVERVAAVGGRYSEQTVDSDDAWSILATCRNCPQVSISMNGINRVAQRFISVTTAARTYHADLIRGALSVGDAVEPVCVQQNSSYRQMWQAILNNEGANVCSFREGIGVMRLIAAIEEANEHRIWIRPEAIA